MRGLGGWDEEIKKKGETSENGHNVYNSAVVKMCNDNVKTVNMF